MKSAKTYSAPSYANEWRLLVIGFLAALVIALSGKLAFAAGSGSGTGGNYGGGTVLSAEMRKATLLVKNESWAEAMDQLQIEVVSNPDNADAWNLIGFSARKMGDYARSETAYDKALAIEPGHKGALEYKGELYLTLGNLAGAETLLAKLKKLCSFNCDEVDDLKAAIAAYKQAQ